MILVLKQLCGPVMILVLKQLCGPVMILMYLLLLFSGLEETRGWKIWWSKRRKQLQPIQQERRSRNLT